MGCAAPLLYALLYLVLTVHTPPSTTPLYEKYSLVAKRLLPHEILFCCAQFYCRLHGRFRLGRHFGGNGS